jgi:hypothetical protein
MSRETIVELSGVIAEQAREVAELRAGYEKLVKELHSTEQARYRQAEALDGIATLVGSQPNIDAIKTRVKGLVELVTEQEAKLAEFRGAKEAGTAPTRGVLCAFVQYLQTEHDEHLCISNGRETVSIQDALLAVDRFLAAPASSAIG